MAGGGGFLFSHVSGMEKSIPMDNRHLCRTLSAGETCIFTTFEQNTETAYQSASFVIVQVDERPDVTLAFPPLGIHKLLWLFITKLHIISAAPPLPLDPVPRRGRLRRRSVPGGLTAALQEVSHTAGLRHRVGHASGCDGINKSCLPDIYSNRYKQKRGFRLLSLHAALQKC